MAVVRLEVQTWATAGPVIVCWILVGNESLRSMWMRDSWGGTEIWPIRRGEL